MKKILLIVGVLLFFQGIGSYSQTLQVELSPDKSKVNRSTKNGAATIFFDSSIEDLSIVCTDENPNEQIIKDEIDENRWYIKIDVKKDIEADGVCYRNFLLRCSASAEYYLTTGPIVPNQVLYYTVTLPNELEPKYLEEKAKNVSEKVNQLVGYGDSYLASILALSVLPSNIQEPDKPYTIEAERALRNSVVSNNAILRGHEEIVNTIDFNSDGSLIVSGGCDDQVILWDARTGTLVKRLAKLSQNVTDVRFLSNDSSVVYSSMDGILRIRNIYTGKLEGFLAADGPVHAMTIDEDGKYVASGTDKIIIWNINTHEQIQRIEAHTRPICSLSFSPDGQQIVSSSSDGTVKLWNCQTGELVSEIMNNSSPRYAIFSHDGKYVAIATLGDGIQIWNIQTGKLKRMKNECGKEVTDGGILSVCFSPDNCHIAACHIENRPSIKIWNVETGELKRELIGHTDHIRKAKYDYSGKQITSASDDKTIRLWDIYDHSMAVMKGHSDRISTLSYSPNGKYIVSASVDNNVKVRDTTTGKCIHTMKGHNLLVIQAAFSPDGKYIVSISVDKTIKVWDVKTGTLLRTIANKSNGIMMDFSFSPDGKNIMTKTESSDTVMIWNISNGKLIREIKTDNLGGSVKFSPDGKRFLSNFPGISLWDIESGKKIKVITEVYVTCPTFSHNGKLIIGLKNNSIAVWDTETGEQISSIADVPDMLSFSVSPNDKYIVGTSEYDRIIRIWDIERGGLVYKLTQYNDVYNVVFSPDGKSIALSLKDNSIKTCQFMPFQDLINTTTIRFSNRSLTSEEKQKYLDE